MVTCNFSFITGCQKPYVHKQKDTCIKYIAFRGAHSQIKSTNALAHIYVCIYTGKIERKSMLCVYIDRKY